MKKWIAMVLSMVMVLAGCAGEKAEVSEKTMQAEQTEQNAQKETDVNEASLELILTEIVVQEEGVFDGRHESLHLSETDAENYPALAEAIDAMCAEEQAVFEQTVKDFTEWALEDEREMEYSNYDKMLVQRADSQIVSILKSNACFTGGAHGMYGSWGVNFDSESGKELLLSDVVTDMSCIPKLTAETIIEKYQEEGYEDFSGLEKILEQQEVESYTWTMDDEKITIYFQPYEIASYAMGLLTAELSFAEHPEVFNEKYLPTFH